MNNKKKIAIASGAVLGCAALGFGAYAFFKDAADLNEDVAIGTVGVDATATLTHSGGINNLNPGDNDPYAPTERPGTDHQLNLTITNTGNKSVITRTIIKVSAVDEDNNPIDKYELPKIIISERATASEVAANDIDKTTMVHPLTYDGHGTNSIYYIIGGYTDQKDEDTAARGMRDVLNGAPGLADTETETGVNSNTLTKSFDIGLNIDVGDYKNDVFEGAQITFTVTVEALQYRNTGDTMDWNEIFEETFTMGELPPT